MSLDYACGFDVMTADAANPGDLLATGLVVSVHGLYNLPEVSSAYARGGVGKGIKVDYLGVNVAPRTTFGEQVAFYTDSDALSTAAIFCIYDPIGSMAHLPLVINANGSIRVDVPSGANNPMDAGGTTLVTSAVGRVRPRTWHHLEWNGEVHASAGFVTVKLNGETLVDVSGIDTHHVTSNFTQIYLGGLTNFMFDNWMVYSLDGDVPNSFIGDWVAEDQLCLTGNGHHAEWTPNTGSDHGALVRESPMDNDTTFNEGDTVGLRETYTWPAPTRVESIGAIQVNQFLRKTTYGSRAVQLLTRSGGTDYLDGVDRYLAEGAYNGYPTIRIVDPATGDPWSLAGAAAVEDGPQVTI
jgi:hypothetical protein